RVGEQRADGSQKNTAETTSNRGGVGLQVGPARYKEQQTNTQHPESARHPLLPIELPNPKLLPAPPSSLSFEGHSFSPAPSRHSAPPGNPATAPTPGPTRAPIEARSRRQRRTWCS
ncbi:hypothetical protein Vretimale_7973, partial [Volvox reticuliferus]